jgi:RNA polymerase sigma-70 factor (ECF subfamily)
LTLFGKELAAIQATEFRDVASAGGTSMNSIQQGLEAAEVEKRRLASFPENSHTGRQMGEIDFEGKAILHMDMLCNYAVWMTGSPSVAQDLLRETYLGAYRRWRTGERCGDARAWMFQHLRSQIAGNCLTGGETQRGSRETDDHFFLVERIPRRDLSLSKMVEGLSRNILARAVRSLPETDRTVIVLCDIQGLTYGEIAELLQSTVDEVSLRIHRARQLLRSVLLD